MSWLYFIGDLYDINDGYVSSYTRKMLFNMSWVVTKKRLAIYDLKQKRG